MGLSSSILEGKKIVCIPFLLMLAAQGVSRELHWKLRFFSELMLTVLILWSVGVFFLDNCHADVIKNTLF